MNDKISNKDLILKVAEQLFVERGYAEAKISDISSAVGISDSTVYEHFANKQEILFTIPREHTIKIIERNEEHLRGLVGAETKLRKLMWNYVEFLTENRNYSYILIFELRPRREFYTFEKKVFDFIRPYKDALIEGINNHEFNADLSPAYVLKLFFGAVDLIIISWLIKDKPEKPTDLFEPFFDLLLHAITGRSHNSSIRDKRVLILDAATSIFAGIGYEKARIQDVARSAGVADGTIYQYFRNKQEILFTIPIEKTEELLSIQSEHLGGIKKPDFKLRVLISDYLKFFDDNKDYASVVLFELRYNRYFYSSPAYELFRKYARTFYDIIAEGIKLKHFRESVNPYLAVQMIFGIMDHSLLTHVLFKKPTSMINIQDTVYGFIIHALKE